MNRTSLPGRGPAFARHLSLAAVLLVPLAGARAPDTVSPSVNDGGVAVEVVLTDGSVVKLLLREERLEMKTPYGVLSIPAGDVTRIEFASRIPEDVARRLADLGSADFRTRESAEAALVRMGERAGAGLSAAVGHKDLEIARRAKGLVERLRGAVPEDRLEFRRYDVVHTLDSRFTGRLEATSWRAGSEALGELRLRLADLRDLRALGEAVAADSAEALPDPGNLTSVQQQVGKRFVFRVTGAAGGGVWGTDVYTSDSELAAAAVHAGVLRPGQAGLVRVKIVASPGAFAGSTRNGITSAPYTGPWGAYQILR
jgi:hypothetical protein